MDAKLRIFKAVANDKRLRIIKLIARKKRIGLSEIAATLGIPVATACRNLKILETAGLLGSEISAATAKYWLNRNRASLITDQVIKIVID